FQFTPGQYLTFRKDLGGEEVRRSYSLCSSSSEGEWRVAIKRVDQGRFSNYIAQEAKVGVTLEVMPPMGYFVSKLLPKEDEKVLTNAADSGITSVLSIIKHGLETESNSQYVMVFGNRFRQTIIIREALAALKNKYMSRLSAYHILSREQQE